MDKPLENTKSIPLQMDTGNNNLFITHNPRRHLQRLLHARPAGGWLASLATTPGAHPPTTHLWPQQGLGSPPISRSYNSI